MRPLSESTPFTIFAGSAHPELAHSIAARLGVPLGRCSCGRFPDGEAMLRLDESIRGHHVFIVQPTSPPVDEHLMELLIFADACRRAAASRITAVVPYFGYARADKRRGRREAITASLVAELIQVAGIDHVLTVDAHTDQLEGFFHVPMDDLTAAPELSARVAAELPPGVVVVSPDGGRVPMATEYARRLDTSVAVLYKRRMSGRETEVTHVVGDVQDRACLLVDDIIATGGTLSGAIEALLAAGARPDITIAATHGLFVSGAEARLSDKSVRKVLVTDTLAPRARGWRRLEVVSVADLLTTAIRQILANGSLSTLRQE
ncbi:MAG: ribose-phosphate diphosphokinase [Ktedonobacterales bacterium]